MIIRVKCIQVPPTVFYITKKMQENLERRYVLKFCVKLGKPTKESKGMLQQACSDSLKAGTDYETCSAAQPPRQSRT